ncbi:hypothetical protein POPTR_003G194550v4 [Populus trichocarpa]|uniref:Uncharacterized protein n=1 Tax=Populus trichocarpa TaxID=3694 RepID=A0ACC0TAJ9_POPTR|nr:hypothetical protein POPTR_003G194550v4 [Populus trichocarpa]
MNKSQFLLLLSFSVDVCVLNRLKSTDPPLWLAPSPALSETTCPASKHLSYSINPCPPKSLFDLLIDGFGAKQILHQIYLQSQPFLSNLCLQVLHFEKNPEEI